MMWPSVVDPKTSLTKMIISYIYRIFLPFIYGKGTDFIDLHLTTLMLMKLVCFSKIDDLNHTFT